MSFTDGKESHYSQVFFLMSLFLDLKVINYLEFMSLIKVAKL